jgi:integrase
MPKTPGSSRMSKTAQHECDDLGSRIVRLRGSRLRLGRRVSVRDVPRRLSALRRRPPLKRADAVPAVVLTSLKGHPIAPTSVRLPMLPLKLGDDLASASTANRERGSEGITHRLRHPNTTPDHPIFATQAGRVFEPNTTIRRAHTRWRRLGLDPILPHECRHTYAAFMIAAGINPKALQTYMGHASITITLDRYGHLLPGNETHAATMLDTYLHPPSTDPTEPTPAHQTEHRRLEPCPATTSQRESFGAAKRPPSRLGSPTVSAR